MIKQRETQHEGQFLDAATSLMKMVPAVASGALAFSGLAFYAGRQSLTTYYRMLGIEWITPNLAASRYLFAGIPLAILVCVVAILYVVLVARVRANNFILGTCLMASVGGAVFSLRQHNKYVDLQNYDLAVQYADAATLSLALAAAGLLSLLIVIAAVGLSRSRGLGLLMCIAVMAYGFKLVPHIPARLDGIWDGDMIQSQLPKVLLSDGDNSWRLVTTLDSQAVIAKLNADRKKNEFKFVDTKDLKAIYFSKRKKGFLSGRALF